MSQPRSEFPDESIERLSRRLDAILRYHREAVGFANEHERLLDVAVIETQALMDDLYHVSRKWGRPFPFPWETMQIRACSNAESDQKAGS